jgi:hypothetical protein
MWWMYVVIVAVVVLGAWGFVTMTRRMTRTLSSHTDRTADSMYDGFDGLSEKQRRKG